MEAAERKINQILTEQNRYEIPPYQRPYSWETGHVEQLLDDLWSAYASKSSEYFIGSIVAIERQKGVRYEVVDGQQRLTTLSMIFARLRDAMEEEAARADLASRVMLFNPLTEEESSPRILLREADRAFFHAHVAGRAPLTPEQRREIQRAGDAPKLRLVENLDAIDAFLRQRNPRTLKAFADHLLSRTSLLMLSTSSFGSAYRLFNVLNARGMPLSSSDLIKTALFQRLPPRRTGSPELSKAWTKLETLIGLENFDAFFTHHYVSLTGRKPNGPLHEAYEPLIEAAESPLVFMETLALSANDHLRLHSEEQDPAQAPEPLAIRALKRVRFEDWKPVLFAYLRRSAPKIPEAEFFDLLERLTYQFWIRGVHARRRAEAWSELIAALGPEAPQEAPLAVFRKHAADEEMLEKLGEDLYDRPCDKAVLLRLEEGLRGPEAETSDAEAMSTIEHVLPQAMRDPFWRERFSEQAHRDWAHKLGNLTLLAGRKNSRAQSLPFPEKRKIYVERNARNAFMTTDQIIGASDWTPAMIALRQKHLLNLARRVWGLEAPSAVPRAA